MINHLTKTEFFIPEDKLEEYKSAGFSPADAPLIVEEEKPEEVEEKPKKKATTSRAKKK